MKKAILKWLIKLLLKGHHLQRNGSGRRRKDPETGLRTIEGIYISQEYRNHGNEKWPGRNMGD